VTALPLTVLVFALLLSDVYTSLILGQPVPFVVAALCVCADLLERGRIRTAAIVAAFTMGEPNVGLPACIALAAFVPRARLPLALSALALGAVSLVAVGPTVTLEYVLRAAPLQVEAEAASQMQLSATYVLHRLGVGDVLAVRIGTAWYAAMIVAGLWFARRIARSFGRPAALVFIPCALALFGGAYVHAQQIAAAIPAALLLASRGTRGRTFASLAVVLLAVPWSVFQNLRTPLPLVGITEGVLVWMLFARRWSVAIGAGVASMAVVYASLLALRDRIFNEGLVARAADPQSLASATWYVFVRAVDFPPATDAAYLLAKVPTWLGLALILAAVVAEGRGTSIARSPRELV
jgi:hypothetical protein